MTTNQNFPNDFLKIWQKNLQEYMQDPKAAEMMSEYFIKFQENYNSMVNSNGTNSSSEFRNDDAKRDEQLADLANRLAKLEERLSNIESKPKKAAA